MCVNCSSRGFGNIGVFLSLSASLDFWLRSSVCRSLCAAHLLLIRATWSQRLSQSTKKYVLCLPTPLVCSLVWVQQAGGSDLGEAEGAHFMGPLGRWTPVPRMTSRTWEGEAAAGQTAVTRDKGQGARRGGENERKRMRERFCKFRGYWT